MASLVERLTAQLEYMDGGIGRGMTPSVKLDSHNRLNRWSRGNTSEAPIRFPQNVEAANAYIGMIMARSLGNDKITGI